MDLPSKFQKNGRTDWLTLKAEFLQGDYKSVTFFLESYGIKRNGNVSVQTAGWAKEKRNMQVQAVNEQISNHMKSQAETQADEIKKIISEQQQIADLTMKRISEMLTKNEKSFFDQGGNEHVVELGSQDLLFLANAQKAAAELQRVTRGITYGQPGGASSGDGAIIAGRILASIRRVAGRTRSTGLVAFTSET